MGMLSRSTVGSHETHAANVTGFSELSPVPAVALLPYGQVDSGGPAP
jgi:hypothetical protein